MREGPLDSGSNVIVGAGAAAMSHISPAQRAETLRLPSMTDKTLEALLYSRRIDAICGPLTK